MSDPYITFREYATVASAKLGYTGSDPVSFWMDCLRKFVALRGESNPDCIPNILGVSADLCGYFSRNGTDGFEYHHP